jgi:hypothetical protein
MLNSNTTTSPSGSPARDWMISAIQNCLSNLKIYPPLLVLKKMKSLSLRWF